MKILAIDQSRTGGYSVFDYEHKKLLEYGCWDFPARKFTYAQSILNLEALVQQLVEGKQISAIFIEDISMRKNVKAFLCLAQLQGVLINLFEKNKWLYGVVPPSAWQSYCGARGRTAKEKQDKIVELNTQGKKQSKILSIQFAHYAYKVDTSNDGIADSIGIGHYVVNNIKIQKS